MEQNSFSLRKQKCPKLIPQKDEEMMGENRIQKKKKCTAGQGQLVPQAVVHISQSLS